MEACAGVPVCDVYDGNCHDAEDFFVTPTPEPFFKAFCILKIVFNDIFKANSFALEFQILLAVLSGNVDYCLGYCRGNGNCGFEYGPLSIIFIVIGCILGF